MKEIKLQYRGKKTGTVVSNPALSADVKLSDEPVWVPENDAKWLMRANPSMFYKMDEREAGAAVWAEEKPDLEVEEDPEPEVEEDLEAEEETGELVCPKCGKIYRSERYYNNHIEKCN